MISPAAAELIRRGREQIRSGIAHVQSGEPLIAEVWLRASVASLDALEALLDEPDRKPMRKLAIVVMPRDEEAEPDWFARKANDSMTGDE
jgi:hypothetical protein